MNPKQASIQEFLQTNDPEILFQTTQDLMRFFQLNDEFPNEVLYKVSENLGDETVKYDVKHNLKAQVRKVSHQFFLSYIRAVQNYEQVLQAMVMKGIQHSNVKPSILNQYMKWQIRQKNFNSLQSLLLSEPKLLNWTIPEAKQIHEVLLRKLQDPNTVVSKACEQTLITFLKMDGYKNFFRRQSPAVQDSVRKFVEGQKSTIFPPDLLAVEIPQHSNFANIGSNITFGNRLEMTNRLESGNRIEGGRMENKLPSPYNIQAKSSAEKPKINKKSYGLICPPFDYNDLENLNSQNYQDRADAITNLQDQIESSRMRILFQFSQEQLEYFVDLISDCVNDHNFKVVLTALNIFQRVVEVESFVDNGNILEKLIPRISDPKTAIRQQIFSIFSTFLQRIRGQKGLQLIRQLFSDCARKIGREELLELVIDLCDKNRFLIKDNFDFLLNELAPLMDDQKQKIKGRTMDVLVMISEVGEIQTAKRILGALLNRMCMEIYLERINKNNTVSLQEASKSWQGQSKNQQYSNEIVVFRTPPRLPQDQYQQQFSTSPIIQQQEKSKINSSVATSSTRSDVSSINTLASRLKNKGDQLASQNKEDQKDLYVPSVISNKDPKRDREQLNRQNNEIVDQTSFRKTKKSGQQQLEYFGSLDDDNQEVDNQLEKRSPYSANDFTKTRAPLGSRPTRLQSNPVTKKKLDDEVEVQTQQPIYQKKGELGITQPVYLSEEDLTPVQNPDSILKNLLQQIQQNDWQKQFDALNNIRRLIKFHPGLLRKSASFNTLLTETIKLTDNLRSGLSKNSLLTLNEALLQYKRDMDPFLETAMQKLIKKSLDTNSFIADEVRRVMVLLASSCSEGKVISILQSTYQSKSNLVKLNLGWCIKELLNKLCLKGPGNSDFEKVMFMIFQYAVDSAAEVRALARECLFDCQETIGGRELQQIIQRLAPAKECTKILQIIDKGRSFGENTTQDFKRPPTLNKQLSNETRSQNKTPEVKQRPLEQQKKKIN